MCCCKKCCQCKPKKEQSFASHVVEHVARAALGTVLGLVVSTVLGPIAGEITRVVITGDVLG
jgi:hypothetical protein